MNQEITALLKPTQLAHLATVDGDQPHLRPMTLIYMNERFFVATGSTDAKTKQLTNNPKAEFCLLFHKDPYTGYLRGKGSMVAITEPSLRKAVADYAIFLYDYWQDANDPDFILFEMQISSLRYMKPGAMLEEDVTP